MVSNYLDIDAIGVLCKCKWCQGNIGGSCMARLLTDIAADATTEMLILAAAHTIDHGGRLNTLAVMEAAKQHSHE